MIELLCPSRGRPQAARELLESFDATKTLKSRLVFVLDNDDKTGLDYPQPQIIVPPTGDPVGPLNHAALMVTADIVGFIGDDSRFETKGWDAKVERAIADAGGGFCWTSDGHDKPWPSTVFISTDIVKALGWLALPTTRRGYFDVVWERLAMATGRAIALPDVMIRHNNAGEGVNPGIIEHDRLAYETWRDRQSSKDAARIRSLYRLRRMA